MKKTILFVAVFILTTMTVPAWASITVAVVGGGYASSTQLAAQLNDDTYFDFTATAIGAGGADTALELSAYDVVILGDSGHRDNGYTAPMFAAIRSYMNAGGGVVSTGWYSYGTDSLSGQAKLDADYVTPVVDEYYSFQSSPGTVNISGTSHPITAGISDYSFSGNHIEFQASLDAGATALGSVDGPGRTVIAYQDTYGRSVYLGGLYMASTGYNITGLRSGVEDQLLEQAVNWASGASGLPAVPAPGAALLGLIGMATSSGFLRRRQK